MKKIIFLLLLISFSILAKAQSDSTWRFKRKNVASVDLLGHCVAYSLNYERIFLNCKRIKFTGETGFGYLPIWLVSNGLINKIEFNVLFSISDAEHIEFGIGATNIINNKISSLANFKIGFRYQNPMKPFVFKVAFTPIVAVEELMILNPDNKPSKIYSIAPWAGITLGYSF